MIAAARSISGVSRVSKPASMTAGVVRSRACSHSKSVQAGVHDATVIPASAQPYSTRIHSTELRDQIAERERRFFTDYALNSLTAAISRYQKLGTWPNDPGISREEYEVSMAAFIHAGVFDRRFSYDDVVWPDSSAY